MEKRQGGFALRSRLLVSTSARLLAALCWLVAAVAVVPAFAQTNYVEKYPIFDTHEGPYSYAEIDKKDYSGVTLNAIIAPDLPPVGGESIYLRRVLDNLIGNAVKFTPTGGTITVQLEQQGNTMILQVTDTGIGIPADQQQRIFERFYQVDGSMRRRYGGMGLGLSLVKEVIEALGGTIDVESELGHGSTFTIALPILEGTET